jgi:hypothetical protein
MDMVAVDDPQHRSRLNPPRTFLPQLQPQIILDFKLSPCLIFSEPSFGCFPGVWFKLADVSEHSICSIFKADDLEAM